MLVSRAPAAGGENGTRKPPPPISMWGRCFKKRKYQEGGAGSSVAWHTGQMAGSFPQENALMPALGEPPL